MRVHVIGFDLDDKARDQLRAVAEAGQGHYYDANNYHTLIDSLRTIVDEVWEQIAEADARYTRPIEGGAGFDSAVRLEPGRYTLKNHLPKVQFAYFFVPTQKGQRGVVWDTLQARALVRGRDGNVKEADYVVDRVSIHIYRPDRKKIKGRVARAGGKVGKSAMMHYMDTSGRGFYFTVGDNYNAVHRDALFDLDIQEAGDRYNGMVAVDEPVSEAMVLPLDEEIAAHLGLEDRADSYRITGLSSGGAGGVRVQIDIAFPNPEFRFHIEVYDETRGKRLKKSRNWKAAPALRCPWRRISPAR